MPELAGPHGTSGLQRTRNHDREDLRHEPWGLRPQLGLQDQHHHLRVRVQDLQLQSRRALVCDARLIVKSFSICDPERWCRSRTHVQYIARRIVLPRAWGVPRTYCELHRCRSSRPPPSFRRQTMSIALFAALSPPLLNPWRLVSPDDAGRGATPHSMANGNSLLNLPGLSPATIISWTATRGPTHFSSSRNGASSSKIAPMAASSSPTRLAYPVG